MRMNWRVLVVPLSCTALMMAVACGSDDGDNSDGGRGTGGSAGAEQRSQRVESEECASHEMRPDRLFEIVDKLIALSADEADPSSKNVYVIPGHWSPFWSTPLLGYSAAKDEMGFSGEFEAACEAGDPDCIEKQVDLFTELTDGESDNREADGIAIGCKGAAEMEAPITAAASSIPVITFDADVSNPTDTGRQLYLGAMNLPAGRSAGETILDLVSEGTVRLYARSFSAANLLERAAGVFAVCLDTSFDSAEDFEQSASCSDLGTTYECQADCTGDHSGVSVVAVAYGDQFDDDTAWQADHPDSDAEDYLASLLDGLLTSDDPPAGLISLHGTPSPVVEKAIADADQGGEVKYVAWDFSAEVQNGLVSGTVDAAMVQNSYFYGYLSAHITYAMVATDPATVLDVLDEYFESNVDDHLLDTGMTVVTSDNLEIYSEYQETCLGLTSG